MTRTHTPAGSPAPGTAPAGSGAAGTDQTITEQAGKPRRHTRRKFILGGAGVLGLTAAGGSAWALNRFVIDHVEVTDTAAYEAKNASVSSTATASAATDVQIGDNTYTSSNMSITIKQVSTGSGSDTVTYYTADIQLADATTVRSAFANNEFGENITAKPSVIAEDNDAVFAINGDYYGFRSDGILIRNGTVYRDDGVRDGIAFYTDGRVEVYDETSTTAQKLVDAGVWNTASFGPALVKDSAVLDGIDDVEVDTNVGNHSIQGDQPRTALGYIGTDHYVFVVVDGRNEGYSKGVTMTELATIMLGLGCQCAYNIDGGGSSAMYFNGSIINQPSNGGERATSDIFYIKNGA